MELKLKKHPNSSNSVSGGLTGLGIIKEQKIINKYNKIITVVKFLIFLIKLSQFQLKYNIKIHRIMSMLKYSIH